MALGSVKPERTSASLSLITCLHKRSRSTSAQSKSPPMTQIKLTAKLQLSPSLYQSLKSKALLYSFPYQLQPASKLKSRLKLISVELTRKMNSLFLLRPFPSAVTSRTIALKRPRWNSSQFRRKKSRTLIISKYLFSKEPTLTFSFLKIGELKSA